MILKRSAFFVIPAIMLALVAIQTTLEIEFFEYKHNLRGGLQGKGNEAQTVKVSRLMAPSDAVDDYIENQQFDLGLEMNLTRGKNNRVHL
jgi:hypothetical protein